MEKQNIGSNVALKLDMTKAYNRVNWHFLVAVLRRFGFSKCWIDLVWRSISNVWYSVMINGVRQGFFHSNRGLKQGDPLSPALFVIGAEVLSRMLNKLPFINHFRGFSMRCQGPQVTHLAYADDVMIFTSGNKRLWSWL